MGPTRRRKVPISYVALSWSKRIIGAARTPTTGRTRAHTALDDDLEGGHDRWQRPTATATPSARKRAAALTVRKAAAQAAVTASKKTGRPVDERVKKIADAR
jgi:hypothetical protein